MVDRSQTSSSPQLTNPFAPLLRIYWLLAGHFIAGIFVFMIGAQSAGHLSWRDAAVGGAVVTVLIARYVDIAYLKGDTADGQPATMQHFWRHALKIVVGALAGWAMAHSLAWI